MELADCEGINWRVHLFNAAEGVLLGGLANFAGLATLELTRQVAAKFGAYRKWMSE